MPESITHAMIIIGILAAWIATGVQGAPRPRPVRIPGSGSRRGGNANLGGMEVTADDLLRASGRNRWARPDMSRGIGTDHPLEPHPIRRTR